MSSRDREHLNNNAKKKEHRGGKYLKLNNNREHERSGKGGNDN